MNRLILLLVTMTAVSATEMICGVVNLIPEDPQSNIRGSIRLIQNLNNGPVNIVGTINGLPQGQHGFHVHEKGDMRKGCASLGPHFNPNKTEHGGPQHINNRHVGDLGNILANEQGIATINITDSIISLSGPNNIIGRSIVVHADEDDLGLGHEDDSSTTGHSGARIACGIIGILLTS